MYSVKQVRVHLGMSQSDLAKELGVHINTYRKMENGKRQWKIDEALMLVRLSGYMFDTIQFS